MPQLFFIFFLGLSLSMAQVGIGTNTPHESSILDLNSTKAGFLPPRMSDSEKLLINNPADGLLIFNTSFNSLEYYADGAWRKVVAEQNCDFLLFPSTINLSLDLGESQTFQLNLQETQGLPGNLTTSLFTASPGFDVTLDGVTNNASPAPVTQDITLTLQNSSSVTPGDVGQVFLQITSECGAVEFVTVNLSVTGCDFQVTPSTDFLSVVPPNGGFLDVSVDLLIEQLGTVNSSVDISTSDTANGITLFFDNSPCTYTCSPSVRFRIRDFTSPGQYTFSFDFTAACGTTKTQIITLSIEDNPRNCLQILTENPGSSNGVFTIDPDGAGGLSPMQAYCDMVTDGGGWTLVMNYNHLQNTNPLLQIRTTNLPLLGSTSLGVDESNTNFWGHASSSLLGLLDISEVRFYGESSGHGRILHFKHNQPNLIDYIQTGIGFVDLTDLRNNFTPLSMHTANLPFQALNGASNRGDESLTNRIFYRNNSFDWRVRAGNDWEMDDNPNDARNSTIHQVWIR